MNYLKIKSKEQYLDNISSYSKEELNRELGNISSFRDDLKYKYNVYRSQVFLLIVQSILKSLSYSKRPYNSLLKTKIKQCKRISESINVDEQNKLISYTIDNYQISKQSREECLENIANVYDDILISNYSYKLHLLKKLLSNISNAITVRVFNTSNLDDECYLNAPDIMYGVKSPKNNNDYKEILTKLVNNIIGGIDFIEMECSK